MPSITRRDLLGATALAVGVTVAGCSGESSSTSNHPPEDVGTVAFDPESYALRHSDPEPILWSGERPTTDADVDAERVQPWDHHRFVVDDDDAATVSVADVDGASGAREFLDSTDYDAATVYVERVTIRECYAQDLCHVRWSESEIDTSYARYYRDADVACETDASDVVVTLIRLPEDFDPSDVNGYGSSRGSGTCEARNDRVRRQRNESEGGGSR